MSDLYDPGDPGDAREVSGRIKWFNSVKGFGFVTVADSAADAFLHLSVLRDSGFESLLPGTSVRCEVADRQKGLQVVRVLEVDESTADTAADTASASDIGDRGELEAAGDFVTATVKWFNAEKGYGFLSEGDNSRDVFIHMVTLRRSGVGELEPGQSVRVRIAQGPKGPQATEIQLQ